MVKYHIKWRIRSYNHEALTAHLERHGYDAELSMKDSHTGTLTVDRNLDGNTKHIVENAPHVIEFGKRE